MDPRMYPGGISVVEVSATPAGVTANTSGDTTLTVPGAVFGKSAVVFVNPPGASPAGVALGEAYVSADNTVIIRHINTTAGTVTPDAGVYKVGLVKYKS